MMRLTLRTLLAYLDDVLSPADTQNIGQKIQESPMAQLLVSRIREVMRRRRLKAPEVFGPEMGIDPNIVAQYLDNALPADQYADVERVLLASDEMLAETAACHQVLTLILGETTEVSDGSRERLYALGPVEVSSQLAVPNDTSLTIKSHTPESISTRNVPAANPGEAGKSSRFEDERITAVPDYLKPAPWPKRLFPSMIVVLLVVVCAVILTPGLWTGFQQANIEMQRKVVREKNETTDTADQDVVLSEPMQATPEVAVVERESVILPEPAAPHSDGSKLPDGLDPAPPKDDSDLPMPKPGLDKVAADSNNKVPIPALPAKDVAAVETAPAAKSATLPQEVLSDLQVAYTSNEGVVIKLDDDRRHWFMVPHRSELKPGEIIANLEPFDGVLELDKAGVRVTMVGETVGQLLLPSEAALQGINVVRGRMILQTSRQEENGHGTIGIAIGEDLWKLDLLSGDTVCGLEVTVREPSQFQKLNDYQWYVATLYVTSGDARWTNRAGIVQEIGQFSALNIIPERAAATVRSVPMVFPSVPDWCEAGKRRMQPLRRYQSIFEKSFAVDQPVEQTMLTLVKNSKNPKIAELAARCLSATDNCAALVETLAECPHEEARFAARDGIRQSLPMNASYGTLLKAELETHYPPADADAVFRMLWGFSRDDVKGAKITPLMLTNWMRSTRLEIRELADYWVERLTGRKTEYRASGAETQRDAQVKRLEEQIERDNGLIKGP